MFLTHRPGAAEIDRFIDASRDLPLSYARLGLTDDGRVSPGFSDDRHAIVLGRGRAVFEAATRALTEWRHFQLGWIASFPSHASVSPGTVVAVLIRHLGFWSLNGCRVTHALHTAAGDWSGFVYGTLTSHAERGEERFEITVDDSTETVRYVIRAASRPAAALAWCGYPVARYLQARFRRESAARMRAHVGGLRE